jgi:D-glycerate 3-kinase
MVASTDPEFDSELEALLLKAVTNTLSPSERQQIAANFLPPAWLQPEILSVKMDSIVEQRLQQLQRSYPELEQLGQQFGWSHCPIMLLWHLWLPLAEQIAHWRSSLKRPLIQGILGIQGTGKTTLTLILSKILVQMGFQVCSLSIDDLYKTYAERQDLQQADPRFRWRGPPGTHDLELGLQVLQQLRQSQFPVALPRFDKSLHQGAGDRVEPQWITSADIVLFEGWFVGVRPIAPAIFETAPSPIETAADRAFALEINRHLQDYLPLWQLLDRLIVLHPSDYRFSQQWRQQAEQQMIATGRTGMSDAEISEFVTYFWRSLHPELFIPPLLQNHEQVDLVIEIGADHNPQRVYCP